MGGPWKRLEHLASDEGYRGAVLNLERGFNGIETGRLNSMTSVGSKSVLEWLLLS